MNVPIVAEYHYRWTIMERVYETGDVSVGEFYTEGFPDGSCFYITFRKSCAAVQLATISNDLALETEADVEASYWLKYSAE
ncbi:hypothetical protein DSO57_1013654 [Entomophthora muscae]|uniref:Uncharacterized protein n=1 Tax=Entomophthora muscae TaxID=34485 RepID=A0ACC2T5X9_9FUNG|nr:hypothetical protein DSO57_1013654 [Entomophthora muscae]